MFLIKKRAQLGQLLYTQLSPQLPTCLEGHLVNNPNGRPLLRLFFQGETATIPFISKTSRDLHLDINILLANIDRFDTVTCGVLVVELAADEALLNQFIERCKKADLIVEILGYVTDNVL